MAGDRVQGAGCRVQGSRKQHGAATEGQDSGLRSLNLSAHWYWVLGIVYYWVLVLLTGLLELLRVRLRLLLDPSYN